MVCARSVLLIKPFSVRIVTAPLMLVLDRRLALANTVDCMPCAGDMKAEVSHLQAFGPCHRNLSERSSASAMQRFGFFTPGGQQDGVVHGIVRQRGAGCNLAWHKCRWGCALIC